MEENIDISSIDLISDGNFVIDKVVCDKFDMNKTKENVAIFIREYKEAKTLCFKSLIINKVTYSFNPNKVFVSSNSKNGGFATSVNNKIDAEEIINNTEPLLQELVKTFTNREKIYYDYCLLNNYTDEYVMYLLGNISKYILAPIKNSCILKFALLFDLAVMKEK